MNKQWAQLNKLSKRQESVYRQCARSAGITDSKFWILYAICESGGILCQNEICGDWCFSKQTVNAAVTAMEDEGLLYLEFAEGSKKQKDLKLTEAGRRFCDQWILPVMEAECRAVMALEPGERACFLSTMEKLLSNLEGELSRTAELV